MDPLQTGAQAQQQDYTPGDPMSDSLITLDITGDPHGINFLITLNPPKDPSNNDTSVSLHTRAPVDFVLVIDVSGSMDRLARAPGYGDNGKNHLTVLDVVKHAVRTIVTSMNADDRVAVVTFSVSARVIVPLSQTDNEGKQKIMKLVEELQTESATNLWDGLKEGMDVLTADTATEGLVPAMEVSLLPDSRMGCWRAGSLSTQRLSSVFLLTDGVPNYVPPGGHIPMLKHYLESHPRSKTRFTINAFGFGYLLDSQLLHDIAAIGKGTYGFIPDAGMVGTVFVHATANTYATFAQDVEINVELDNEEMVDGIEVVGGFEIVNASWGIKIELGALQYGQTKDVVVRLSKGLDTTSLTATANYRPWWKPSTLPSPSVAQVISRVQLPPVISPSLLYHMHRLHFVQNVLALFSWSDSSQPHHHTVHTAAKQVAAAATRTKLELLAETIRADFDVTEADRSPYSDALLLAKDIEGEVLLALDYDMSADNATQVLATFSKWGRHYLPSLARSHQLQQCGNFKDASLQVYGRNSPLFVKARDDMNVLFNTLPPPTPFIPSYMRSYPSDSPQVLRTSMASWNQKEAPCFAGHCLISVAQADCSQLRVDQLRRGIIVQTPAGSRIVAAILRTAILEGELDMCTLGNDLVITPWHPIKLIDNRWVFPSQIVSAQRVSCEAVYSILLEPDHNSDAHAVWIAGMLCVTLGHGLVGVDDALRGDVRAHPFFGDYNQITRSLSKSLDFYTRNGMVESLGTFRSRKSGMVSEFVWSRGPGNDGNDGNDIG